MTAHTLAILAGIGTLLVYAYTIGSAVAMTESKSKISTYAGLVFSVPTTIFTVWLILTVIY